MDYNNRLKKLFFEYLNMSQRENVPNFEKADYELMINSCLQEKKYEQGLAVTERAIAQFPHVPDFFLFKAELLMQIDEPRLALGALEEIKHLSELNAKAMVLKAKALTATGKEKDALSVLEKMESQNIGNFNAFSLQATILEGMDMFDDLYRVTKNQILTAPKGLLTELLRKQLFYTEVTENHKDAIHFYKILLDRKPFLAQAWLNLGMAYKAKNKLKKAIDAFEFCIAIDDTNKHAYMESAECYLAEHLYDAAIGCYTEYLSVTQLPDSDILTKLADAYFMANQPEEAEEILLDLTQREDCPAEALNLLGNVYIEAGRPEQALPLLQRARLLVPESEDYLLDLAEAYFLTGQDEEAAIHYEIALEMAPDILDTWLSYYSFLFKTRRLSRANELLDELKSFFNPSQYDTFRLALLLTEGRRQEALSLLQGSPEDILNNAALLLALLPELTEDAEVIDMIFQDKRP